jgi:hypothetical protein
LNKPTGGRRKGYTGNPSDAAPIRPNGEGLGQFREKAGPGPPGRFVSRQACPEHAGEFAKPATGRRVVVAGFKEGR